MKNTQQHTHKMSQYCNASPIQISLDSKAFYDFYCAPIISFISWTKFLNGAWLCLKSEFPLIKLPLIREELKWAGQTQLDFITSIHTSVNFLLTKKRRLY